MSGACPLVVVGAGGFGRETLDVVEAVNRAAGSPPWQVLGVLDDAPSSADLERLRRRGIAHLGPVDAASRHEGAFFLVGVGSPAARQRIAAALAAQGLRPATVVHPAAVLGSEVVVGEGSVVCAGVQVSTNVVLGRHVHLNAQATVGHDSVLDDCVSGNPGAIVSGACHIGTGALLGAGSVVLQGLSVGPGSVVGAAACVVADVPAGATVKGVPAR